MSSLLSPTSSRGSPACTVGDLGCDLSITHCIDGGDSSPVQEDEGDEGALGTCSGTEEFTLAGAVLPSLDGCYTNTVGLEEIFEDFPTFSLTGKLEDGPFIAAGTLEDTNNVSLPRWESAPAFRVIPGALSLPQCMMKNLVNSVSEANIVKISA